MENTPTAEQFLSDNINRVAFPWIDDLLEDKDSKAEAMKKCMIEFAKLHVEAALKAAAKDARTYTRGASDGWECWEVTGIDENSILGAYPETNIK